MLKPAILEALNEHLNKEYFSAYYYLSMVAYFKDRSLDGFAHWMLTQHKEELIHALKVFNYINDRDGRVKLMALDKPSHDWVSPSTAIEDAYKHEVDVSERINKLVELCIKENDHMTNNFLQWFVSEQVEEEASFKQLVDRMKLIGNDGQAIFMLDLELSKRANQPTEA